MRNHGRGMRLADICALPQSPQFFFMIFFNLRFDSPPSFAEFFRPPARVHLRTVRSCTRNREFLCDDGSCWQLALLHLGRIRQRRRHYWQRVPHNFWIYFKCVANARVHLLERTCSRFRRQSRMAHSLLECQLDGVSQNVFNLRMLKKWPRCQCWMDWGSRCR